MIKNKLILLVFLILAFGIFLAVQKRGSLSQKPTPTVTRSGYSNNLESENATLEPESLTIDSLKKRSFQGSDITVEETLDDGSNYQRFIVSYKSDGLKIYALLTVPTGEKPKEGWPVIIFNHGYILPKEYRTTERYVAYVDGFARNGYIVFRPDYRGHGNSEGVAPGGYGSNAYTIDVLNALASIKKYKNVDSKRIGMWGHSMGGFITLRAMVANKDIKAGVIWSGVVGSYNDLLYNWRRSSFTPPPLPSGVRPWRDRLIEKYGTPEKNPTFWNSISANSYLSQISGPLQLHHATSDDQVPVEFSQKLYRELQNEGKTAQYYEYPDDNHNLSNNFVLAMQRSVDFFDTYVKNSQ